MAEQQDDDIGREIIRLMQIPALAAVGAGGHGLEEMREQTALATGRAAAPQRQSERWAERARRHGVGGRIGEGIGHGRMG